MSYSMKNQSGQGAKDMKRVKFGLSTKITACILTVQIIVMAAMVLFIGNAITNDTRRSRCPVCGFAGMRPVGRTYGSG